MNLVVCHLESSSIAWTLMCGLRALSDALRLAVGLKLLFVRTQKDAASGERVVQCRTSLVPAGFAFILSTCHLESEGDLALSMFTVGVGWVSGGLDRSDVVSDWSLKVISIDRRKQRSC